MNASTDAGREIGIIQATRISVACCDVSKYAFYVLLSARCSSRRFPPAWGGRWLSTLGAALFGASACGDALLPADYDGPAAAEVGGSVVRTTNASFTEASAPRFSIEWLQAAPNGKDSLEEEQDGRLYGQTVAFTRSAQLRKDWDLEFAVPRPAAKIRLQLGAGSTELAIGKLVYFDDKNGDGRVNWGCARSDCDQVKAMSEEFVVFLDQPLTCTASTLDGVEKRTRLSSGFHYFQWPGGSVKEVNVEDDLRFELADTPASWVDPTTSLQRFMQQLQRTYGASALGGC